MTTEQKQLISTTVPVLKENGLALTTHFYHRLFSFNPELKNMFNMGNQRTGQQQMALAMAVLAYAENIDAPAVLGPALNRIGHKHTSLVIRPEHYAIVGKHLLASIQEVLGELASPELLEAWAIAYQQLAGLMIGTEEKLYADQINKPAGWTGWRSFIVKAKVEESLEITSFHLYPADGGPVAGYIPGQYLSVKLWLPQLNLFQPRQYSISNAPNQMYYRISVKRETSSDLSVSGMISNHLHDFVQQGDLIEVSAPAGEFILEENPEKPVLFISGGVGQTPLLSMLERLINDKSKRPVKWIHGCRNRSVHAFKDSLDLWMRQNSNWQQHIFYDDLSGHDHPQEVYKGFVDLKRIVNLGLPTNGDYYLCGPKKFIRKQFTDLIELGVHKEAIRYEEFGPQLLAL